MNWYNFIQKIKPDGKAFRSILNTKILFEVIANGFKLVVDYAIFNINDQVWYVNDNFNPEPWEARYGIVVPELATLEERREVVKSYMLYPQSGNRLSRDYIQDQLISKGFTDILVEYNSPGNSDGFLRANDFGDEKVSFPLGALVYNSFIISGTVTGVYYNEVINTVLGLKPLQVALYDKINIDQAFAYDETLALALDDNNALAITIL
jgi:hypothetical protein